MNKVKFLHESVKAGRLSNAEAKEFLSLNRSSNDSE